MVLWVGGGQRVRTGVDLQVEEIVQGIEKDLLQDLILQGLCVPNLPLSSVATAVAMHQLKPKLPTSYS